MNSILLGVVGPWQIILIVVVVVLLFGGKKIPELMKGVGQGIKEFKDGMNGPDTPKQDKTQEQKKDTNNDKPLF